MRVANLAAMLGVGVFVAGCGQSVEGQAEANSTEATTNSAPTGLPVEPIPEEPGSPGYLTEDTLCDLLSNAEAESLGLQVPGDGGVGILGDECEWFSVGNGSVGISYGSDYGVAELREIPGDTVTQVVVGDRAGKRSARPDGSACGIYLVITQDSLLAVSGIGGPGRGCELVDAAAPLIEARLP